jgi:hypothetical protein
MASSSSSIEATSNDGLVQGLDLLSLTASTPEFPEYLPFHPSGKYESLRQNLSAIPRYLFRISSPQSDATTDETWVKSKDAMLGRGTATRDIFEEPDGPATETLLDKHLRWRGHADGHDNLVSWTSSLLFALQYIFYRHNHWKDGSSLEHIHICIIDTTAFPRGVFIQDLDLIRAFKEFDQSTSGYSGLQNLHWMRTRGQPSFQGSFYFGEYLSQGSWRIEGRCQIVSAQSLIDSGLFILRPELEESMTARRAEWSNRVIELRELFYHPEARTTSQAEESAALQLATLFRPGWRLPFVANLLALTHRDPNDSTLLLLFRSRVFSGIRP